MDHIDIKQTIQSIQKIPQDTEKKENSDNHHLATGLVRIRSVYA